MKVKKALGLISEKFRESQKCESCGEDFICGASFKGCWCFDLNLDEKARTNLKLKFNDCLCQNCLGKLADTTKMI